MTEQELKDREEFVTNTPIAMPRACKTLIGECFTWEIKAIKEIKTLRLRVEELEDLVRILQGFKVD